MPADTAVFFELHLADPRQSVAQALACAQQARLGGRQAEAVRRGVVALGLAFEVAGAQDVGVLRQQFHQSACDAGAQGVDRRHRFVA